MRVPHMQPSAELYRRPSPSRRARHIGFLDVWLPSRAQEMCGRALQPAGKANDHVHQWAMQLAHSSRDESLSTDRLPCRLRESPIRPSVEEALREET